MRLTDEEPHGIDAPYPHVSVSVSLRSSSMFQWLPIGVRCMAHGLAQSANLKASAVALLYSEVE